MSGGGNISRYAAEKLYQALSGLVGGNSFRERLAGAGIILIRLGVEDFPEPLWPEYLKIMQSLTKAAEDTRGEGTIAASVRALSDIEAERTAQSILGLYVRLKGGI